MKTKIFSRFGGAWHRVASWGIISAFGIGTTHRLPGLPFKMYLEPKFRSVGSAAAYCLGVNYEAALRLLPCLVRPGDAMIDCGANQGLYALYGASIVGPAGRVVAIEPQPYAVAALRKSIAANGFAQLTAIEAAVSDQSGVASFGVGEEPVSASLFKNAPAESSLMVRTVTVDEIVESQSLERVSFIKLDVEGAELQAIRGATRTLTRDHPTIVFEAFDITSEDALAVWRLLETLGYEFHEPFGDGLRPLNGRRVEGFNIFAIKKHRVAEIYANISQRAGAGTASAAAAWRPVA